mmetsp:Transcript_15146/g.19639  ORF Transcript_15146/g.19639 Transcript_15146/m.19639 type:complete len:422 (-) Transcript_15146:188-1453(-)|eukprot:CAMPEP_0114353524 /NCGR_PEP_ID=MMETSP0101-20121206/18729_1 /TAXON_ID=38822 ORGANISM="Pteridomonas danica, Strain PT" /NCGR_SAMPLE_ID=MMETSP0101 /ASSEMBLY_ACC=CAM_ASM_000211 /LENGTH=421 /DNA_ID=CAMNT_0001494405 /DNA_START=32 /DNA_END=1297 /DNA_ORIENTATION=+
MGKGGDKKTTNNNKVEKEKWIKVYDKYYDMTEFKHPGGNIVELFYGLDGTTGFESFHGHNKKKAETFLKSIPQLKKEPEKQTPQTNGHVEGMSKLIEKWYAEGLFEPLAVSYTYGLCVVLAIVVSIIFAPYSPVLCGLIVGTAWAHCGFLQHMGGHYEMGVLSDAWQHFFEGFCKGGSSSWWRNRHNKHHAKTNVLGEDGDLRTTPFFAWDPVLAKKVPDWSLKTQAFTFIPALGAYVFIFAYTVRKYAIAKKLWFEVVLMIAHYAAFAYALSAVGCSLREGLTFYATGYAFQGIYLGFFFGLSHFAVERVPSEATWLESTMLGTVDWAGDSVLAGYASGFLNLQIEHHMAPQMPMENLRKIRADSKKLALEFNVPYRELSFFEAIKLMLGGLYKTGRDELAIRHSYTDAAAAVIDKLHAD